MSRYSRVSRYSREYMTQGLLGLSRRAAGARSVGSPSESARVSKRGLGGASSGRAATGRGGRVHGGEPGGTPLPRAVAIVRLSTPRGPPHDMCDIDDTVMGARSEAAAGTEIDAPPGSSRASLLLLAGCHSLLHTRATHTLRVSISDSMHISPDCVQSPAVQTRRSSSTHSSQGS